MKKIAIILSAIVALWTFNTCSEDFLTVPAYGVYTPENLTSKAAANKLLIACYSALNGEGNGHLTLYRSPSGLALGNVHGAEALKGGPNRQDLVQIQELNEFNITTGNSMLILHWQWLYDAVDRCNRVINQLELVEDMTENEKTEMIAEARFLRAHFYFYLKRTYDNVPWLDENTEDLRVPNTVDNDGVTYVNIWPNIAADMDFARKNLPEEQIDWGRPNKWAAECYYAKILIYRANWGEYPNGYSEALTVLDDVMANGVNMGGVKYALVPNYHDMFNARTENNSETVFAIELSVNDGTTSRVASFGLNPNANYEGKPFSTQATDGPGLGRGWGFYQPSQWFVDHFRVNANGLPYLDMFETNPNYVKNDMNILSSEAFDPETEPLDPRLDWSVGRRGIPYLDFGINPGKRWIREQSFGGPYIQKKFSIRKDEYGEFLYDASNLANALNTHIIRYADVILLAAECNAHLGNLDEARDLVNQVRDRMIQNSDSPDNWVKLDDGVTNAANYLVGLYPNDGSADDAFTTLEDALTAILYERTLELGLEGHRFFDVVRFGKGDEEFNDFADHMTQWMGWFSTVDYTDVPDKFAPIPREAIDNSQKEGMATLTQNPGY